MVGPLIYLLACSSSSVDDTGAPPVDTADADADTDTDSDTDADTDTDTLPDEPLELCINEFMPDNEASLRDETAAYPDWIELHNPSDATIDLEGWVLTDARLEPERGVISGLTIDPGGFVLLYADGMPELGAQHLGFSLDVEGGEVALFAPDGRGNVVTYGAMAPDFSIARVPDCCEGDDCLEFDFRGTPGESNVEAVYESITLLPAGSTWLYWDQGVDPGEGWESAGFDDSAWLAGPGPLGYGDTHQLTTVGYGPSDVTKYITTWFRTTFEASTALDTVTLSLLRDDGAIVYLNGVEVVRDNMPDGDVTADTLSVASTGSSDETAYWDFNIDPSALVEGTNTVAVELHQSAADSSDLGFDLSVDGQIEVVPE